MATATVVTPQEVDVVIAQQERIEEYRKHDKRDFEEQCCRYEEQRLKGHSHWAITQKFARGATRGKGSRVFIEGNKIFSYGHHFVLATRKEEGDWGEDVKFIVNGDRYSSSTSGHTSLAIQACKPNVQIPYTALEAAGLCGSRAWGAGPHPDLRIAAHDNDRWFTVCRVCSKDVDNQGTLHLADESEICRSPDGKETWRYEHVLGGVVMRFSGKYYLSAVDHNEPWRMRSYFLCELPRSVSSVADAYMSLKPQQAMDAEASGLAVRRQGDVFLIPGPSEDWKPSREYGRQVRDHHLWGGTHIASRAVIADGRIFVSGKLTHEPHQHRVVYFNGGCYDAVKNTAIASWNAVGYAD